MINELTIDNFEHFSKRFEFKVKVIKEFYWIKFNQIPIEEIDILREYNYLTFDDCLIDLFPNYLESIKYFNENSEEWSKNEDFLKSGQQIYPKTLDEYLYFIMNEDINLEFNLLFTFSHNNQLFFNFCSFSTYKVTFDKRFTEAKHKMLDLELSEFLKIELIEVIDNYSLKDYLSKENQLQFYTSTKKKSDYLKSELKKLNINYVIIDPDANPPKIEFIGLDSFDLINLQVVETIENIEDKAKVIFLCETGILEHLFKKYSINGSKAEVNSICSILTGIGKTTIQSYINPILLSNGKIDKTIKRNNNPYTSEKAVIKANEMFKELKLNIKVIHIRLKN